MGLNINIENQPAYQIPSDDDLKDAIREVLKEKKLEGDFEVDLKFVDAQEIHKLNREYREIDKPTDVLSFPIHEIIDQNTPRPVLMGDIVICPEMAQLSLIELIKHATLHLLGYHHKE